MTSLDTSVGSVPTGTFASDPLAGAPSPAATVSLTVTATQVASCDSMAISWSIANDGDHDDDASLNLFYSTVNVPQNGYLPPVANILIMNVPMRSRNYTWNPISVSTPGYYVITASGDSAPAPVVVDSSRFLVTTLDTSCLSGGSSPSSETPSASPSPAGPITPTSIPGTTPASTKQGSNTGAVIGGVIAGIAVTGLIVVFFFWRRRQALVKATTQRTIAKRGHHKWGGLPSIDKTHGEIPVVMSPNSPYGKHGFNHSQSTARALTEEGTLEKGYGDDDNVIISDVPELPEQPRDDRKSRRYSSEILAAALKDDSGLAAFNEQYNEQYAHYPATAKVPILSTTSPTTAGAGDDPFTDDAFIARGKRASSLSVPSTARTHSRVSDVPSSRGAPSPLPLPSSAGYQQTPPATMQAQQQLPRLASAAAAAAAASVGRPTRKPVPQYTEDSFELTNTSRSSPTTTSRRESEHMSTTPISTSPEGLNGKLSASESSSAAHHWLHERAPVANRHIGLAGQNEGPVHYLIPDPPPSHH